MRPSRFARSVRLGVLLSVSGCRGDNVPAVAIEVSSAELGSAEGGAQPSEADPLPERVLWWDDGDARAAILARERRDHDAARRQLEAYLAQPGRSGDDVGAASYLLGLEQAAAQEFEAAAASFAVARDAPRLSLLEPRIRLEQARARLRAGQAQEAWALLDGFAASAPLTVPASIARGDALSRLDRLDEAVATYRTVLGGDVAGPRTHEVRAKLARLLERGSGEKQGQARALWERVLLDVPLSDFGQEAGERLPVLDRQLGPARKGKSGRAFTRKLTLRRIHALLGRRRYQETVVATKKFLARRGLPNAERCEALYLEGSAIFKQRRRADARGAFDKAAVVCKKAGAASVDLEVKSRYQGARGWYAAGKHVRAAMLFGGLATDHSDHSYEDDAWLMAGEAFEEAGKLDRARKAYDKVAGGGGDMADEGWRRRALLELAAGRDEAALTVLDGVLARGVTDRHVRSRAAYLRARVLDRLGRAAQARVGYLRVIENLPLDYPALQSLSRLRERGDDAFAEGVGYLERASGPGAVMTIMTIMTIMTASPGPGVDRAQLLARLGLGDEALEELKVAHITGWPAVALLTQAGLYREAQRAVANLGLEWKGHPPSDEGHRRMWLLAHPLPFHGLVSRAERAHGVPDLLAYGIMQTESLFNPGATSWAGARGLIQLMPGTAEDVARRAGKPLADPAQLYDPATNLDLGIRYLGSLVGRFGAGDGAPALAVPGYNAGAAAVDGWLAERGDWDLDLFIEAIPYDETRKYAQKVLGRWYIYRWLYIEGAPHDRVPYLPLQIPARAQRNRG